MLRLHEIMTRDVLTVSPTTTLREAAELLSTRHVGGAPVVEGSRVVGVVSASDILAFAATSDSAPDTSAAPDADDWDGACDGEDDGPGGFFGARATALDLDLVDEMTGARRGPLPGAMDDAAAGLDALDRHLVAEVMTRRVVALPPAADAVSAARRLRAAEVHRVLVVDGDRLLGIVTTTDIVRAVADRALERRTYVFAPR
jgi:CBS domain-containing protein